jgi:hypothetical protein
MYLPGEDSVAEGTHRHALAIVAEETKDPRLLFDHRQASEAHDLSRPRSLRAAIKEASGEASAYTDVDAIAAQFADPQADGADLRRYWLNQRVKGVRRWLPECLGMRVAIRVGARPTRCFQTSSSIACGGSPRPHRDRTGTASWAPPTALGPADRSRQR